MKNEPCSPLRPASFLFKVFLATAALGCLAQPAFATERTWTGAVSPNWSEPGNWSPAGTPQNGDLLDFDNTGANKTMENDMSGLVCTLSFQDADYTLVGGYLILTNQAAGAFTSPVAIVTDEDDNGLGVSMTVTINCDLIFPGGGGIYSAGYSGLTGQNQSAIYLNHTITVQSGVLTLGAWGAAAGPLGGSFSGHINVGGALEGAGDVSAEVYDSSAESSLEFNTTVNSTNFTGNLWLVSHGNANNAPITFNQAPGVTVARVVGVRNGDTANLQLNQSDQSGTTLDIESGGQLLCIGTGAEVDVTGILMRNDAADTRACALTTGACVLGIGAGGIAVRCDNNNVTPLLAGFVQLNGVVPIDVHGTANIGLQLGAALRGGGFTKLGASTLMLKNTSIYGNTFTGEVDIEEGSVDAWDAASLGSTAGGTVLAGGSLTLRTSMEPGETLTANGQSVAGDMPGSLLTVLGANPITWDGPVMLNTNLVVVGGDLNLDGPISGAGGLFADNSGTIEIGGSDGNTFSGTLLARCPLLELNKPSGTKAYAGPLVVGGGFGGPYEARWLQPYQNVDATLTLYPNGVVNLNNHNEDFGAVTFNGGTVETGSGQFAIYQPLTVNANSAVAVINGFLGLPSGNNADFVVADGAADPDLLVNAVIFGTPPLVKQGPGTMELANANTYASLTLLEGGILGVANPGALGGAGCHIFDGATLRLDTVGTISNPLEAAGAGVSGTHGAIEAAGSASATLSGTVLLDSATVINVAATASLACSSSLYGTGPVTKIGAGPVTFSGSIANSYSGNTTNQSGLLYLAKSGGALAIPGNLVLGPAPANGAASAIFESPNSIGGDTVTVNANSVLNLNGREQTLLHLNLNDGGGVLIGNGALNFANAGTISVGSLNTGLSGGSHVGSTIQGNLGMPPNAAGVLFNVNPYSHFPPYDTHAELVVQNNIFINAPEDPNRSQTGIGKTGEGRMEFDGNGVYQGLTSVNGGTLQVDGSLAKSAVVLSAGTLKGTGLLTGPVFLGGTAAAVAPGDSPGILTCGNLDNGGGSGTVQIELNGTTPGASYSQLDVNGTVDLNGLSLSGTLNFIASTNDQFTIIANDGTDPVTGTFNGLPEGATVDFGSEAFRVTYRGGDGNDVVLTDMGLAFRPELAIEPAGAHSVRLLWPTNDLAFSLQSVTNLEGANWTSVSPPPVIIGAHNVVTNAASAQGRFYRLIKP
jgi:autotransporter-associated beta strand protein